MSSSEAEIVTLPEESSSASSCDVEFELVTSREWREEWTMRDTASVRLQLLGRVLCCRNKPRIRWIRSKSAILVLLWNCLTLNYFGNLGLILADVLVENSVHTRGVIYLTLLMIQALSLTLLYPLAGWLADVYFGRYRVIKASLWLMWTGTVLLGLSLCLNILFLPNHEGIHVALKVVLFLVPVLAMETGMAGFNINAVPFGFDQLTAGSGDQLSGFVTWYVFATGIKFGIVPFPFSCPFVGRPSHNVLVEVLFQAVLLSAALILDSFFRDWFIIEPHTSNPFKLVATVLRYAWKNKQPQFRSAFTYQDHTKPSRIEFAKANYGGPFTTEQVEDVKTVLRIVFALVPIGGSLVLSILLLQSTALFSQHVDPHNISCYGYQALSKYLSFFIVVCAVPLYEFLIFPIMHNYIPTMLTRFGIGIILHMLSCVTLITIDIVGHEKESGDTNHSCLYDDVTQSSALSINPLWTMLPQSLVGLGIFFNLTATFEFVFSQSPYNMKGLLMGAVYAIHGLFIFLSLPLQVPFYLGYMNHLTTFPTCASVHEMAWLALSIFWFTIFVLVSCGYHKRERGETKRQQDYPEEYYSKYLRTRH